MTEHPAIQNAIDRCRYLYQRYQDDRCSEIAAALVYMSLFALVPLLTLTYAISTAVPTAADIQAQLQQFLVDNLLPEASQDVADYLASFSQQAKNLTGVGIAILATTAVLMLRNVERAFNNIWRNRKNRGVVSSLLLYWAVLSLAPILLGLGIGIKAYLFAAAHAFAGIDVLGVSSVLLSVLPFGLGILGLTALYMAVPNCAVPFRHALIGGLVRCPDIYRGKSTFHCSNFQFQLCPHLRCLCRSTDLSTLALYQLDHYFTRRYFGTQSSLLSDGGTSREASPAKGARCSIPIMASSA